MEENRLNHRLIKAIPKAPNLAILEQIQEHRCRSKATRRSNIKNLPSSDIITNQDTKIGQILTIENIINI